jgi:hypothetical protein
MAAADLVKPTTRRQLDKLRMAVQMHARGQRAAKADLQAAIATQGAAVAAEKAARATLRDAIAARMRADDAFSVSQLMVTATTASLEQAEAEVALWQARAEYQQIQAAAEGGAGYDTDTLPLSPGTDQDSEAEEIDTDSGAEQSTEALDEVDSDGLPPSALQPLNPKAGLRFGPGRKRHRYTGGVPPPAPKRKRTGES